MVYYMDNSILIASGEKELTGILNTLARYMQAIGLKINFTKIAKKNFASHSHKFGVCCFRDIRP